MAAGAAGPWEHWPAVVSAAVAVCALLYAVWQGWQQQRQAAEGMRRQREHDRVSVRPHLQGLIVATPTNPVLGISVENTGLGPAEIVSQRVYVGDKEVKATDAATYTRELDRLLIGGERSYLEAGSGISAGTTKRLFTYEPSADASVADEAERQWRLGETMRAMYRLCFVIEYQSMYGEGEPPLTIDLRKAAPPAWIADLPTDPPPSARRRASR